MVLGAADRGSRKAARHNRPFVVTLIALITDKERIDLETAKIVRSIVEYELQIRRLLDPIDAEGTLAKLEEMIRRALKTKGPLKDN